MAEAQASVPKRFSSVDALRGITVAGMLLVNNPGDWGHVYSPLLHAPWHGCTPTDLIFPFFLFIVGVSIALGIVPRAEMGTPPSALRRAVWVRGLKIIGLGLFLHAIAWWLLDRPAFRPFGVLQRIGLCFIAAGLVAIYVRPRAQWLLIASLLLGYWFALELSGGYGQGSSLPNRMDALLLGPHAYRFDALTGLGQEPEGLLSTLPAIATTLLGLRVGDWLRVGRSRQLLMFAAVALPVAWLWSYAMPFNKALWTSSYALWAAGLAAVVLWVMHQLIDLRAWPALGRRFGVNAITAFAGSALMVYVLLALGWWKAIYQTAFASWMTPLFGPYLPSLAFALSFVGLWWCIVYWMDKQRCYVKL